MKILLVILGCEQPQVVENEIVSAGNHLVVTTMVDQYGGGRCSGDAIRIPRGLTNNELTGFMRARVADGGITSAVVVVGKNAQLHYRSFFVNFFFEEARLIVQLAREEQVEAL